VPLQGLLRDRLTPLAASIVAIGDEIVGGLVVDTNSPFVADTLRAESVDVVSGFAVPDDVAAIRSALERALDDAALVVTTGGLGPTSDDLTTAIVAEVAGVGLELHEPSLRHMEERFRSRGLAMPPNNVKQAMLPAGCVVVPNEQGTAPGYVCRFTREGAEKAIASFPGVPDEMVRMVREGLIPMLRAGGKGRVLASRTFSTVGLGESALDEILEGLIDPASGRLAFRAAFPRLYARVTLSGESPEALSSHLDEIEAEVRRRLGEHLYAVGDRSMEEVVGGLLRERELTLSVAESCTGGLIGHRITDVPGSSEYFLGGVVAYANEAKTGLLDVRAETLAAHGAVSAEVAEEMARGVRRRFGSDLGLATTGIAGPGGGTPAKPVGTVHIALSWEGGAWSRRFELGARGREWIKGSTAQLALDALRRWLIRSG
jgi:nicotinamide-nucleotide amidase